MVAEVTMQASKGRRQSTVLPRQDPYEPQQWNDNAKGAVFIHVKRQLPAGTQAFFSCVTKSSIYVRQSQICSKPVFIHQ